MSGFDRYLAEQDRERQYRLLSAAWHEQRRRVDEDLLYIEQSRRLMRDGYSSRTRVEARAALLQRLERYRRDLRAVSETQERMDAAGIAYQAT